MRMVGHVVAPLAEMTSACKILVVKPEGSRPLGIRRSSQEHRPNNNMDSKHVGWEGVDLIHLVQNSIHFQALVNMMLIVQVA
jgi:hypothetical protein